MSVNKKILKAKLASGETEEVLDILMKLTENSKLHNEVIQQSNKFKRLQKDKRAGTISYEEQALTFSKISNALIQIIDEIPDAKTKKKSINPITISLLVGFVFLLLILLIPNIFSKNTTQEETNISPTKDTIESIKNESSVPVPAPPKSESVQKKVPPKNSFIYLKKEFTLPSELTDCLKFKGYTISNTQDARQVALGYTGKIITVDPRRPSYAYHGGHLSLNINEQEIHAFSSIKLSGTDQHGIPMAAVTRKIQDDVNKKIKNNLKIICDAISEALPLH